jgi:uncharacterized protein (DUF302 family)
MHGARSRTLALLAALACLLASARAATPQEPGRVEQTPYLFIVRSRAPFDDVLTSLQEAIKRRNYVVTGINDLGETLRRRDTDVGGPPFAYEQYKAVGFCNLTLADEAIRANPHVGAFLPCRAVVYRERGARQTIVVAFRPSFLSAALGRDRMEPIMRQAEADILAILTEVAAD